MQYYRNMRTELGGWRMEINLNPLWLRHSGVDLDHYLLGEAQQMLSGSLALTRVHVLPTRDGQTVRLLVVGTSPKNAGPVC